MVIIDRASEVSAVVVELLADLDAEDRLTVLEDVKMLYCMFCGIEHPKGRICQCWNDE